MLELQQPSSSSVPRAWCTKLPGVAPHERCCCCRFSSPCCSRRCSALHIHTTHHALRSVPDTTLYIFYSDQAESEGIRAWLQPLVPPAHPLAFLPQRPSPDLGERMAHALETALARGHTVALLAGTDIPDLSARHFAAALAAVQPHAPHVAAFGPAADGGYYLVALRPPSQQLLPQLFTGIEWSTASVLRESTAAAERAGLAVAPPGTLPMLQDIDTRADLEAWAAAAAAADRAAGGAAAAGSAAAGAHARRRRQELLALAQSILAASREQEVQR